MRYLQAEKTTAQEKVAAEQLCLDLWVCCAVLLARESKSAPKISGFAITVEISGRQNNLKFWKKLMKFGRFLGCHQKPERSFFIKKHQFPVCARCTGVYAGQILGIILVFFLKIPWYLSLISLVPMGLDWSLQHFKKKESNNIKRVITGFFGGFGIIYLYYHIINAIIQLF